MNPRVPTRVGPDRTRHQDRSPTIATDDSDGVVRPRRRATWAWVRLGVGVAVLVVLVAKLGTDPFVEGVRRAGAWPLLVATAITALTTLCCAWRWRLVAGALGTHLAPRVAFAAVYRAQFLNATLPGGVLGDVDRAVNHGRDTGSLGRSARAVFWERTLGQVVQVALTVVLVVLLPSSLRAPGLVAVVVAATVLVVLLALRGRSRDRARGGRRPRIARAIGDDLGAVLRDRGVRVPVVVTSAAAATGHVAIFLVAARTAGVTVPLAQLVPLAAVVLLASSVPANVAGWGPREGVAAWAFGAAGLGATAGLTTSVVYGVMALVATVPGAVVLLGEARRPRPPTPPTLRPAHALEEVARG